jgi:hypothetical protein
MKATGALLAVGFTLLLAGCAQDHSQPIVAVEANDCQLCHIAEYEAATSPPHVDIFPGECALCHSTTAWQPATFAHETVKDRECSLCHQADYDGTADPVHAGTFPTTCGDCHGTIAWRPALNGEHPETAFPITEGPHKSTGCTDCHDVDRGSSSAGMNTDCVGCHTGKHSMEKVNDQHQEVADYIFDAAMPNFCLLCHPNGRK